MVELTIVRNVEKEADVYKMLTENREDFGAYSVIFPLYDKKMAYALHQVLPKSFSVILGIHAMFMEWEEENISLEDFIEAIDDYCRGGMGMKNLNQDKEIDFEEFEPTSDWEDLGLSGDLLDKPSISDIDGIDFRSGIVGTVSPPGPACFYFNPVADIDEIMASYGPEPNVLNLPCTVKFPLMENMKIKYVQDCLAQTFHYTKKIWAWVN